MNDYELRSALYELCELQADVTHLVEREVKLELKKRAARERDDFLESLLCELSEGVDDLFAALEVLVARCENPWTDPTAWDDCDEYTQAVAALARARGESVDTG